jgi:Na+-translocating ferredoxin:NAD+ oxidoreductase RNF subunit RnfB
LDCGSCGAPSCRALAEDIVNNEAEESDCIINMRDELKKYYKMFDTSRDKIQTKETESETNKE